MKTALLMVTLAGVLMPLAGCESLTRTPRENINLAMHTMDTNIKQIPDDLNKLALLDHPVRFSDAPIPNN